MNKKELSRYANDCRSGEPFDNVEYEWKWFATLIFPDSRSLSEAYSLFHPWFSEIERKEGINRLDWVRVTECGSSGIRFHLLVGGSRIGDKWHWIIRWQERGGDGFFSYYRPRTFFHHVLREAQPDGDFDMWMDIGGCFWIFRDYFDR